jgi:fermentation-respiration switch protein FrsA (DUF1100 family)
LKAIDVPTLIIHGDDDQIVLIGASARAAVKLVKKAKLIEYKGAPHGVCTRRKTGSTPIYWPSRNPKRAIRTSGLDCRRGARPYIIYRDI